MATKTTGKKAAKAASKTLSDGRTSKTSKTAAGSALSQVEKKKNEATAGELRRADLSSQYGY